MDTFIFHRSTYTPSMMLSIPLTTFAVAELNKIQRRATQAMLNKLGVNKNFPCRVAFSPKDMCGMALLGLSIGQGVRQAKHFLNHLFAADSVGNLILIALRCLQLESGCGFHLLEQPKETVTYITECWLTSLRDFLTRHSMASTVTDS